MTGDRDRCLAVGMNDYLSKPISREALLRGVKRRLPNGAVPSVQPAPSCREGASDFSAGAGAGGSAAVFPA